MLDILTDYSVLLEGNDTVLHTYHQIQLRGLSSWPQPPIGPWGRPPPQHLTGLGNAGMNHRHHGVIRSQTGTATAGHCPD